MNNNSNNNRNNKENRKHSVSTMGQKFVYLFVYKRKQLIHKTNE